VYLTYRRQTQTLSGSQKAGTGANKGNATVPQMATQPSDETPLIPKMERSFCEMEDLIVISHCGSYTLHVRYQADEQNYFVNIEPASDGLPGLEMCAVAARLQTERFS
jgi:hypothetical protein